jgi:nitrite reductase/ring-hydroxylating ferredoxin subunit
MYTHACIRTYTYTLHCNCADIDIGHSAGFTIAWLPAQWVYTMYRYANDMHMHAYARTCMHAQIAAAGTEFEAGGNSR